MTKLVVLVGMLLACNFAHAAPVTVDIAASPSSGGGSVATTLTWSSKGAASCTASGGWSGAKALSGTEVMPAVSANTDYVLTCLSPTGEVTITWGTPTQNTDGSTLTDLANFRLFRGPNANALIAIKVLPVTPTTYKAEFSPGPNFFAMTALNASGVESALSATANKTVVAEIAQNKASVSVEVRPLAPVNFQVR